MNKEKQGGAFVTYRFDDGQALSIQLLGSSAAGGELAMEILDEQLFAIQGEGDRFAEENIRRETVVAFFWFMGKHKKALRRLG